jgi:hypothetical protein
MSVECTCDACRALAERYQSDPRLLAFYRRRLLVRGWAGQKDEVERAYILAHAPYAQAAVKAGAGNLAPAFVSRVDTAPTDAGSTQVVPEDPEGKTGRLLVAVGVA